MDCIFCKIATGEIPSKFLYEDENVVAFADLHPQAPVHVLIIPRKHIQSLNHLSDAEMPLLNHMVKAAQQVAKDKGIYDRGYKLVINTGKEGGQVIQHFHLHLLGGRNLDG
ncbi:MAG: histidine triad nucleotide-binding protein [Dehalococcoidales bacterium]|nr:histidine triad nucleotide-binding protein [Dehalococcoidales bacterium]